MYEVHPCIRYAASPGSVFPTSHGLLGLSRPVRSRDQRRRSHLSAFLLQITSHTPGFVTAYDLPKKGTLNLRTPLSVGTTQASHTIMSGASHVFSFHCNCRRLGVDCRTFETADVLRFSTPAPRDPSRRTRTPGMCWPNTTPLMPEVDPLLATNRGNQKHRMHQVGAS